MESPGFLVLNLIIFSRNLQLYSFILNQLKKLEIFVKFSKIRTTSPPFPYKQQYLVNDMWCSTAPLKSSRLKCFPMVIFFNLWNWFVTEMWLRPWSSDQSSQSRRCQRNWQAPRINRGGWEVISIFFFSLSEKHSENESFEVAVNWILL